MNAFVKSAGVVVLLMACEASAAVRPAAPFGNDMVLQRDRKVPVWGEADAGERVRVEFGGQVAETSADAEGKWRVDLAPMSASETGRTLKIGAFVATNVVVGEVWLCSGQSNMGFSLWPQPRVSAAAGRERNGYYDLIFTDEPMVRGVTVPTDFAAEPRKRLAKPLRWNAFTPDRFDVHRNFSGVAFHYALRLRQTLKVPVGVVVSAWGGSRIEPWVPACGFAPIASVSEMASTPIAMKLNAEQAAMLAAGKGKPGFWRTERTILFDQPRCIYNAMICPLEPFAMRGAIWYQGEANVAEWQRYGDCLRALKRGWAERFENPDFAFYLTQIATYGDYGARDSGDCRIREEMERFADEEPNCGCATAGDIGELTNIHPSDKRTVATRLAALALNRTYAMKYVKCDAPKFDGAKMDADGRLVVSFRNVEGWCKNGREAEPFEIAGEDGKYVEVKSEFEGNRVRLQVPKGMVPRFVAYQRRLSSFGHLRNEAGLPVFPFIKEVK